MATTLTTQGQFTLAVAISNIFSGDTLGLRQGQLSLSRTFANTADAPAVIDGGGFVSAELVTCANGEWHLADPADPFQGMGDAVVSDAFNPVGKNLVLMIVISDDENTDNILVKVPAANGCPVLDTPDAGYVITPGGAFLFIDPNGTLVANLVRGTNDILEIEATGSPTARVICVYSTS